MFCWCLEPPQSRMIHVLIYEAEITIGTPPEILRRSQLRDQLYRIAHPTVYWLCNNENDCVLPWVVTKNFSSIFVLTSRSGNIFSWNFQSVKFGQAPVFWRPSMVKWPALTVRPAASSKHPQIKKLKNCMQETRDFLSALHFALDSAPDTPLSRFAQITQQSLCHKSQSGIKHSD